MTRFLLCLLALTVLATGTARAALSIDVSSPLIKVTTGFNGSSITVFGTQDVQGALVILVEGPSKPMTIRKKSPVFGLWTYTDSRRFANLPVYYETAASAPIDRIAAEDVLRSHRIGLTNLLAAPDNDDDGSAAFSAALVRLQQKKGVYVEEVKTIDYISPSLFKAVFDIPPIVRAGTYKVSAFLFQDGQLVEQASVPFDVAHEGLSADMRRFATKYSFIYGLAGVLMAMFAGWLATVLLKRE